MPKPWTAQFSVSHGQAVEKSPSIGVFSRAGPSRQADLYVLANARNTPDVARVCQEIVETVAKEYRQSTFSTTSALTAALNTIHGQLKARNSEKDLEERLYAGVTCAVLQVNDLYLAQAGPSLAYVYTGEHIKRHLPPYNVNEMNLRDALGIAKNLRIHLQHHRMLEGDLLLMASPSLGQLVTDEELVIILTSEPDKAIQRLYLVAKQEEDFSALLVAFV